MDRTLHAVSLPRDRNKGHVYLSFVNTNTFWYADIMPKKVEKTQKPHAYSTMTLHLLKDGLLELTLNLLARVIRARLAVETEKGTEVELGGLEELDLSYVDLWRVSG